MERLQTAIDLFERSKRLLKVNSSGAFVEKVFELGFYVGMASFIEFMHETAKLPKEDGTEQLLEMEKEVDAYLKKFEN